MFLSISFMDFLICANTAVFSPSTFNSKSVISSDKFLISDWKNSIDRFSPSILESKTIISILQSWIDFVNSLYRSIFCLKPSPSSKSNLDFASSNSRFRFKTNPFCSLSNPLFLWDSDINRHVGNISSHGTSLRSETDFFWLAINVFSCFNPADIFCRLLFKPSINSNRLWYDSSGKFSLILI